MQLVLTNITTGLDNFVDKPPPGTWVGQVLHAPTPDMVLEFYTADDIVISRHGWDDGASLPRQLLSLIYACRENLL